MPRVRMKWDVSAGAVLAFALLYFFDGGGILAALAPAVAVHELGHVLALRLWGHRLRRVSIGAFGLRMDYIGVLERPETVICAAAGPLAGLVYALALRRLGGAWQRSGAFSLLLSGFNALPVLPLDGGRIVEALVGERAACQISRWAAALLTLGGGALALRFHTPALLVAGVWLLAANIRGERC